jgi:peptidoglycan/xylan/chitin deacetylase (PgdA/CDA1 family)
MRRAVRAAARVSRPAALVARAARSISDPPGLTILGWHRLASGGGLSTSIDEFRQQLDTLDVWGAVVLPLAVAATRLAAGTLPERAVTLTFDDGYASVVETAWPLLRERRLTATLYVVAGYLDGQRFAWDGDDPDDQRSRLIDRRELAAAATDGLDIGSHSVTHPWLPHLGPDALKRELADSRSQLEEQLGSPITSLAYPMGGWNSTVRDAAAAAGYETAVTVDRGLNYAGRDRLALRRSIAPEGLVDFRLVLDGAYTWLRPVDSWRVRNGPRW